MGIFPGGIAKLQSTPTDDGMVYCELELYSGDIIYYDGTGRRERFKAIKEGGAPQASPFGACEIIPFWHDKRCSQRTITTFYMIIGA